MKTIYDKLVRDHIPAIIRSSGKVPVTTILDYDGYRERLREKLLEEVEEFLRDNTPEELCDILEVVYALAASKGVSPAELEEKRREKARRSGGFQSRILLQAVEDPE